MTKPTTPCRLVTAEDLLSDPTNYEFGELWDGVWQVGEPSGGHAEIAGTRIAARLVSYADESRFGWVTGSNQGFLVHRDPDRVLSPDAALTSRSRLPAPDARQFFPCAPDFAVEVVSYSDRWDAVVVKAGVWIAHGTQVVWVVDPQTRRVAVVRPDVRLEIVEGDGIASAEPAVPGFSMALRDVFRDLPPDK